MTNHNSHCPSCKILFSLFFSVFQSPAILDLDTFPEDFWFGKFTINTCRDFALRPLFFFFFLFSSFALGLKFLSSVVLCSQTSIKIIDVDVNWTILYQVSCCCVPFKLKKKIISTLYFFFFISFSFVIMKFLLVDRF